jgi:hypothetical protein
MANQIATISYKYEKPNPRDNNNSGRGPNVYDPDPRPPIMWFPRASAEFRGNVLESDYGVDIRASVVEYTSPSKRRLSLDLNGNVSNKGGFGGGCSLNWSF